MQCTPRSHAPAASRTTCPYCGVGCGVSARPDGHGGAVDHRRSRASGEFRPAVLEGLGAGRDARARTAGCCIRCCGDATAAHGARRLGHRARRCRRRLRAHRRAHGPDAVAFYLSGQLLTEDYYVANKLMKGFLGSANVDTNSRLCMASSVAGHRRAFGADTVPGCYEDLDEADLIVLVGSNAAWCHPVLYQRMIAQPARARRQDRGDRSAPHRDRRRGRSVSCRSRPAPTPRCSAACWCISRTSARSTAAISAPTPTALPMRSRARSEIAPDAAATAAATGLDEGDVRAFLRSVPRDAADRHLLFAGREPVGARHRQGQRHHQLPPRHRAHRQARHGAVLAHRPAQCDGRARGRRPRQSARRAYGLFARRDRPRAPLLGCAAHGRARGPQGRADVRGDRARRDQGAVGDGDQSRGVAAARRRACARR